ncbi:hypothetical protein BDV19DRAFT_64913 [Aspergillus venezuelensis]
MRSNCSTAPGTHTLHMIYFSRDSAIFKLRKRFLYLGYLVSFVSFSPACQKSLQHFQRRVQFYEWPIVWGVVYPASNYRLGHVIVFAVLVPLVSYSNTATRFSLAEKSFVNSRLSPRVCSRLPFRETHATRGVIQAFAYFTAAPTRMFSRQNDISRPVSWSDMGSLTSESLFYPCVCLCRCSVSLSLLRSHFLLPITYVCGPVKFDRSGSAAVCLFACLLSSRCIPGLPEIRYVSCITFLFILQSCCGSTGLGWKSQESQKLEYRAKFERIRNTL